VGIAGYVDNPAFFAGLELVQEKGGEQEMA